MGTTLQTERQRAHARAVQRARQRLVEQHRAEYHDLLEVEKAALEIRTLRARKAAAS